MTHIINIIQKEQSEQTMTSLEIAELTGKQHKNIMQAIRNMEPAWEKVQGLKFQLSSRTYDLPNGGTKEAPVTYSPKPSVCTSPRSSTTRHVRSWCCAGNSWNSLSRNADSNSVCPVRRRFWRWRTRSSARDCAC